MFNNFLTSADTVGIKRMLDASDLRHKYLANNVANQKTPGYVPQDIDFQGFLKNARDDSHLFPVMDRTNPSHMPELDVTSPFHMDGEFVRLHLRHVNRSEEDEMASQALNSLTYRAAADLLSRKYRALSAAITGGK